MSVLPKTKQASARLDHVRTYLRYQGDENTLRESIDWLLNTDLDRNRGAIITSLIGYFMSKALIEWFSSGDMNRIRNLFYNIGKLSYIGRLENWTSGSYQRYTVTNVLDCMPILVCDHSALIQWCMNTNYGFSEGKNRDKPHSYEFVVKNIFLAMRQQWDELEERSRLYIANPRPRPFSRLDIFEFEYFLGLATGDIPKMEAAILELVTPKGLRTNSSSETGFTDGLISTRGILFAKLAWRSGYEVNIDSPYIPKEWLPVQPLERYEDEFDFMRAYTIDPTWGGRPV